VIDNLQLELFPRGTLPQLPGELIRAELLRRGWGQEDLANIMDRPLPTINKIIQGKKAITPETAIGLAKAFETTPDYWMAKEVAYQLSQVDTSDTDTVEQRSKLYAKAPVKEMVKRRWIATLDGLDKVEATICRFLNIPSIDKTPPLLANARSSTDGRGFTAEQAVWCYRAYHLAKLIKVSPYKSARIPELRQHLRNLSNLAANVSHVPKLLAEYGIRLVIVQHLTGSKIDGAAFWLDGQSPVIVLSLRFDRVNYFWHTLAHELSHIYHNDADVDSDSFEGVRLAESPTEIRANEEASSTFMDESELMSFIRRTAPQYTTKKIIQFANRLGVHPSIVLGNLQFKGELDWAQGAPLQTKYRDHLIAVALTDGWGRSLPPFK